MRFWAENISPDDVVRHALPLLEESGAGVAFALFPSSLNEVNARAFRKLKDAGIELTFWVLLSKEDGYFPGEKNVDVFLGLCKKVFQWAEQEGVLPDFLAIDEESPLEQAEKLLGAPIWLKPGVALKIALGNLCRENFDYAKGRFSILNSLARDRGVKTLGTCIPVVLIEEIQGGEFVQDLFETPVLGVDWDIISPMIYTSMLIGMSAGLISRKDASWLLYRLSKWLDASRPHAAGVSLGVTGTGVLGNEPAFSSPLELVSDVETALSAGIRDITIYSLEGIISRGEPEIWFKALENVEPRVPPRSGKVDFLIDALALAHRALVPLVELKR
ncbi:MAG: hypothetical protein PHO53_05300 [Actinomycetota bacterium]|nr:hypothetical protein [Actinomycetota bacterium]